MRAKKLTRLRAAQAVDKVMHWLWRPPEAHEPKITAMLRALLRVTAIFLREFQRDNIPLRASALTFTIVLSLVPTLALGTAVLKGLGAGDQMREVAYRFIDRLEGGEVDQEAQAAPASRPAATNGQEEAAAGPRPPLETADQQQAKEQRLTGHLRRAADQIFDYVERTDFATLGAFGVIGLVLAVLSVLGSIEQAMNVIWQAPAGRPLGRKLMDYLALMILLPLSVNLALATETMFQNEALLNMIQQILPIAWLTHFLLKILPALLVMLTFTVLYRFLPNIGVRLMPALAGGVAGGLSWFLIQGLYVKMQIGVARYNAIYGSFATLPLFLLWLYIAWVVFLAGAEFSFACQQWRTYLWARSKQQPLSRLSLAFFLLEAIAEKHARREIAGRDDLLVTCGIYNFDEVRDTLAQLVQGGFICRVRNKEDGYLPGAPVEKMPPAAIMALLWGEQSAQDHPLAAAAFQAAVAELEDKKLLAAG